MTQADIPWRAPLLVSSLKPNKVHKIDLRPDASSCDALARHLGISAVRKLSLTGQLHASGKKDWEFTGQLGATVVQPCSVTLVPVTTRLDVPVRRLFLAEPPELEPGGEYEMPEDDTTEPLGAEIDPGAILAEALALALPDYPRAPDAQLPQTQFSKPGLTPMSDADARPFAGLAGLRDSLGQKTGEND